MGILDHLTCFLRNLYAGQEATVRTRHGTMDWFKTRIEVKAVYCHYAYLTSVQCTSCKIPGWMNHKLESRLQEKYQQPHICRYHSNGRKQRGYKEPIDESEKGESKSWLKTQHSKN